MENLLIANGISKTAGIKLRDIDQISAFAPSATKDVTGVEIRGGVLKHVVKVTRNKWKAVGE